MSRIIDHVERVSESFDALDAATQTELVCELFARLEKDHKFEAVRRIWFHGKVSGIPLPSEPRRRNGKRDAEVAETLQGMESTS